MQRDNQDKPAVIFSKKNPLTLERAKLNPGSYYVYHKEGLRIYYANTDKDDNRFQEIFLDEIYDSEDCLTRVINKKQYQSHELTSAEQIRLTRLLHAYHDAMFPQNISAKMVVELFRKFYKLNKQSEDIIFETALGCLKCAAKTYYSREHGSTVIDIIGCSLVYLERFLAATAQSNYFLSLLNIEFISFPQDGGEFSEPCDGYSLVSDYNSAILDLLNEPDLMTRPRSIQHHPNAYNQPIVIDAVKIVLEKILLPAMMLACKYSQDLAIWNSDFIQYLGDLELNKTDKYKTSNKRDCLKKMLNYLELHFLRQIQFNLQMNRSDLVKNGALIRAANISLQPTSNFVIGIESSIHSSLSLFRSEKRESHTSRDKAARSRLRKSG